MNRFRLALAALAITGWLTVEISKAAVEVFFPANADSVTFAASSSSSATAVQPGVPAEKNDATVLHLNNGDFAIGELADCDNPKLLRWKCPAATAPFDFLVSAVSGVYFPERQLPAEAAGDYCVELTGGDVLFGSLADLNAKELVLDSPKLGRLRIERASVSRLLRWKDSSELIYFGPHGLAGWLRPNGDWREEAGELVSARTSWISGNFNLPPQACIEFEVSWKSKPDFVLAFGTNAADENSSRPYRIEVLAPRILAWREAERGADLAEVQDLTPGAGRLHLQVYLDQQQGRMLIVGEDGKQLANLSVADAKSKPQTGIHLVNKGDLRLERLRISRWNGRAPHTASLNANSPRVIKTDGSPVEGEVDSFDAAHRQFVLRSAAITGDARQGAGDIRVDANQIESITLAPRSAARANQMRAVLRSGLCVSGKLEGVFDQKLKITCAGIAEPILLPVAELQSIVVLTHETFTPQEAGRSGRLEAEGVRLKGWLVDSIPGDDPAVSPLVWRPQFSPSGSPLRSGLSGRIVYRDPPRTAQQQAPQAQGQFIINGGFGGGNVVGGGVLVLQGNVVVANAGVPAAVVAGAAPAVPAAVVGRVLGNAPPQPAPTVAPPITPSGPSLYLRAGDIIPCRVTNINELGVNIQSPITDAKFVPHNQIKAVELLSGATPRTLDKNRRERLLTLPRMQRDNPPTQLVVSTNGDYLRGRLTEMDDKNLAMEVQLENRKLARNRVSKIIWFHPDELDDSAKAPAAKPDAAVQVQALRNDGVRLTFSPQRVANSVLTGASDILGVCRVELGQVDQLLLGGAIGEGASQLPYAQWKLHKAKEPVFAQDNPDEPNPNAGTQSPLVGKPAPDFELKLLGGGKFRLSEHKGQIVVLDFWATWCGPCVNAMPQVDKAIEEFKDQKVQLVAVNMQEDQKAIKSLLERLDLHPTVALDTDGTTAEKYSVTAIPQTVIIDAEGKIARLFIGGGPTFGDQLSAALKDVLDKHDANDDNKPVSKPAG